ncbi:hypothetical protein DSO57_1009911 [Entomophthora muscae]|uniref:Uncharacterized protein n=1 Tax=Entomophthora muscae TaxID=34485 RepID=A0ACC2U572_9FUNG|nr:hypothetical protein DSO57_1009911 [Entomophthora muscae]
MIPFDFVLCQLGSFYSSTHNLIVDSFNLPASADHFPDLEIDFLTKSSVIKTDLTDMVLEFDSWDEWKSMATKCFENTHMNIVKKLEMTHIQDYKTIEEFIDAYHTLAYLSIQQEVQKGHQSSKSNNEHDFNSGIGLTFFKCAVPLVYCMAIEERDIEDLSEVYNLVEKLFHIKVENLTEKKARQESEWNPFRSKPGPLDKTNDLTFQLAEILTAFIVSGKATPQYHNSLCSNCGALEHCTYECPDLY